MWLFHPLGFASIVADEANPSNLLARGRFKGDLERLFSPFKADVRTTPKSDYRFRVTLPRQYAAARLQDLAQTIDYNNFKNAAAKDRHGPYLTVWTTLYREQQRRVSKPRRARRPRRDLAPNDLDLYDDIYRWRVP